MTSPIQLTTEQQATLKRLVARSGKPWEEVLDEALTLFEQQRSPFLAGDEPPNLLELIKEFKVESHEDWQTSFSTSAGTIEIEVYRYESDGDGNREFHRHVSLASQPVRTAAHKAVKEGTGFVQTIATCRVAQHGRDEVGGFNQDYKETIRCSFSFQRLPLGYLSCSFGFGGRVKIETPDG
jgi:hypothetical protein